MNININYKWYTYYLICIHEQAPLVLEIVIIPCGSCWFQLDWRPSLETSSCSSATTTSARSTSPAKAPSAACYSPTSAPWCRIEVHDLNALWGFGEAGSPVWEHLGQRWVCWVYNSILFNSRRADITAIHTSRPFQSRIVYWLVW